MSSKSKRVLYMPQCSLFAFRCYSTGLCQIQCFFRRSAFYGFWALNRCITHQLFHLNRRRRKLGRAKASSANDPDPFVRHFGSAQPASLPESTEWWRKQSRELAALTDEAELGLMSAMVTTAGREQQ